MHLPPVRPRVRAWVQGSRAEFADQVSLRAGAPPGVNTGCHLKRAAFGLGHADALETGHVPVVRTGPGARFVRFGLAVARTARSPGATRLPCSSSGSWPAARTSLLPVATTTWVYVRGVGRSSGLMHSGVIGVVCGSRQELPGLWDGDFQVASGWACSPGRSAGFPPVTVAPARASATRCGALTVRQWSCADSVRLTAMASPAARDPGPCGDLGPVPDGGESGLDRGGGARVHPVPGGVVVERQQLVQVTGDLRGCLREFGGVGRAGLARRASRQQAETLPAPGPAPGIPGNL
jgi:hypothetical protein